jgi:hypothetical protein
MKKTIPVFVMFLILLGACAHGSAEKRGVATMFYSNPLEDVFSASKTVLTEQEFTIIEINRTENFIKAAKAARVPGMRINVTFKFRTEGNGTWIEIDKKVPPQFIPGSTAGYRMDLSDLFRYVDLELERNY